MKKGFKITSALLAGLLLTSATACGPTVTIDSTLEGKKLIMISHYGGGHGTAYMDTLIENFMKANPEYAEKYAIQYKAEKLHSGLIQEELESGLNEKQAYVMSQNDFVHFIYTGYLEDLSDVSEMKVDGADKPALKDKMLRYDTWQSIYSKYGEGLYAMPYADSIMGFVYDHDTFVDKGWYTFATESADGAALAAQGITYTVSGSKLLYSSSTGKVNYEAGDRILTPGKDGKYGTYDDGQPVTVADWDSMIMRINATAKAFISSGKVGSYANMIVSSLFGQIAGSDAWYTYFDYDSDGKPVKLADGTETVITLENGYRVNEIEGLYKAYEFLSNYFDDRKESGKVSLHPDVSNDLKDHLAAQNSFILGFQDTQYNPQSAMLLEGAWWEYEARNAFATAAELDASRGYGKREYRFMLLPDIEGQVNEKSCFSSCESGAMIVPKDPDKERLQVTKEFIAYMASDEALNVFLTETGSLMPYQYNFSDADYEKLTPFAKNMLELYSDEENIEILRPQIATLSPLSYAGGRPNTYFSIPAFGTGTADQAFKIVRTHSLEEIKTGLKNAVSATAWAEYIQAAQKQGFYKD